jgi:hypothetical protein
MTYIAIYFLSVLVLSLPVSIFFGEFAALQDKEPK